jgi:hypothetical protein
MTHRSRLSWSECIRRYPTALVIGTAWQNRLKVPKAGAVHIKAWQSYSAKGKNKFIFSRVIRISTCLTSMTLHSGAPPRARTRLSCLDGLLALPARTDVYGYLLATVNAGGKRGAIKFEFKQIHNRKDEGEDFIPDNVKQMFSREANQYCLDGNSDMSPAKVLPEPPDAPCTEIQ